ncbi:MAG: DUF721 domain-containing protein [Mariprofundaceae bacterium]
MKNPAKKYRPRSRLTPLQSGLSDVLGEEQLQRLADIGRVRRNWAEIVGPVLAQHTEPLNIEAGCLHIAVDHPAMAQQVRFLQQEIRDACFRRCRIRSISNVRTRMQPGAGMPQRGKSSTPPKPLTWADKRRIAGEIRKIRNKALRRAIYQARINQLRYA